jgi:RNA polymerase sigma-70 factor (sigma-E family)
VTQPNFDEYVSARSGALLRSAYLICGDRHLAEDLVQEVFIKAHRRWSQIEADNPDAYLKRAIVRTHVSWLRRRSSSEIATDTFREDAGGDGFDEAHASREELWNLLDTLPRAQRAVLVLRYFEDLDDRRIAELVGISESTVRVHAHRGLNALRETLAQRAAEAPTGVGMLESVQRGAARAATRRRAAPATAAAAVIAALALVLPQVFGPRPGPGPIDPSPSVTSTGTGQPGPTATTPAPTPTVTVTAPALTTLGPLGYGPLVLGMTKAQARATGLTIGIDTGPNACGGEGDGYLLGTPDPPDAVSNGGWLVFGDGGSDGTSATGLAAIWALPGMVTPEGIQLGSTRAEVEAAYPDWEPLPGEAEGRGGADVPGNPAAFYHIEIQGGVVIGLSLDAQRRGCYQ